MRASSPAASPPTLTGTRSVVFGPLQLRQRHVDRERARRAVDGEPLHADRAARHALGRGVERPAQRGDHIGAGAPVVADRNAKLRDAGLHVLR